MKVSYLNLKIKIHYFVRLDRADVPMLCLALHARGSESPGNATLLTVDNFLK